MGMNHNKSKQMSTQELTFFYNLNIEPLADEYKQCCQTKRKTDWTNISLFIVSVIFVIGAFKDEWSGYGTFYIIIFLIVYSFGISGHTKSILSQFENKTVPIMLSYFEPNFTYLETNTIEIIYLKSFGVYPDFDSKKITGSVFGRYKNRDIRMLSISLRKEIGDGSEEVFKGLIIIVNIENELFKPVTASSNYHQNFKNLPRIHLTNFIYNSNLYVHSDDKLGAHALITKPFVEHLYHLEKLTGLNLTFGFNEGLLLISIPTELPNLSFYWQDLRYDFNNIMECLQLMFDVLDILQLDLPNMEV